VDVSILTAGSPYGKYMTVDVFRLYTKAIVSIYLRRDQLVERVLTFTGGGSAGLVITFLIIFVLLYKCQRTRKMDDINYHSDQVICKLSGFLI